MKRTLLIIATCLFSTIYTAFSQSFTAGNIVIYRYGDGVAALPLGTVVPCFLDEYTTGGTLVKSRPIPTTTVGANFRLTGLGKLGTGLYQQEGMSTLSQDKKYITIFGYNQAVGSGIPTTTDGLVVGVVAADASYNSTTTLSNAATVGLGAPRSAIINGSDIWANGFQNGVQYTTLGSLSTSTRVSVGQNAPRTLSVFNNNLYAPIGSSGNLAQSALPTASATFTTITFAGTVPTSNQTAFFNVGGRVLMYVVDDAANTIRRYYLNTAGTTWNLDGTATTSITTEAGTTDFVKSITGIATVSGSNTIVDLYATTWGDNGTGSATSKLIKITDTYLNSNPLVPASTSAITTLATAPANTTFRSVTLAPENSSNIGSSTLPIALNSFDGKKVNGSVQLSWATASENNNAHFDILRSANGRNFQNIGQIKGNGATTEGSNYGFMDENPLGGVNYYQLNQVDFDGKSSKSKVIAVEFGSKKTDFTVFADKNANVLSGTIFADNATVGDMSITDMAGRVWLTQSVKLNKGDNVLNISVQLNDGVFIITLKTPMAIISKKFINY